MDDDTVAHQTHLAILALELAVLHVATGNSADAGDLVGLTHLGVTQHHLAELRCQHTLHSGLDLVDGIVDDAVHTHIHVGAGSAVAGSGIGTDVEADDDRLRGGGQHDIALVDGAHTAVDDADADFLVGDLLQGGLHGFHAALHVGLDDQVQVLHLTGLDLAEQILQRDLGDGSVGLGLLLFLALLHQLTSQLFIADGVKHSTGGGSFAKTGDLHGNAGAGLGKTGALVADHGTDTTHGSAGDDDVALLQRTVLHQQRCHRAATLIKASLDNSTLCHAVGVGLQLAHLGGKGQHLQQGLHAHTGLGGDGADDGVAAPLLAHETVLGQLLLDALGVGSGLIHLVDSNNDGDLSGLGVVDGLDGLGHDAVVGSNHQNGDIGNHSAAGTHGGKGLMAGGIQEGDGLTVQLHLISTDVLGDAAGLAGGNVGVADIVQQAGLTMVNVTHDHHNGGTGQQIFFGVLMIVDELLLDGDDHFLLHLAAHFLGNNGGGIEVDHLAQGCHNAVLHQALDHLCAGLFHAACQLANGDLIGDLHGDGSILNHLKAQLAQAIGLFLTALVALLTLLLTLLVAELLLVLELIGAAATTAMTALSHILQLLVILSHVHVGGLAGIHHLLLRHAGHGLLLHYGSGRFFLLLILLLSLLLTATALLTVVALLGFILLLLGTLCLLLLRLCALGEDGDDVVDLVVLGQILKYQRELTVLQHLHVVFGGLGVLGQDLRYVLRGDTKILRHLMHSIFVCYATQIKPPPSV